MAETGDETRDRDEKRDETERDEEERGQELKGGRSDEARDDADRDRDRDRDDDGGRRWWPPPKKVWIPLVVVVLIGLIVLLIGSCGEEATEKAGKQESPIVGGPIVQKRFAGLEQDGLALGDPQAPVTLVQYVDLQCPLCKKASDNSLPVLIDRYVKPGRLRIEFRNHPILGVDSDKAGRALDAAAQQGKAAQFIDLWFLNQGEKQSGYVTDTFIRRIAQAAGLDGEAVADASNEQGTPTSIAEARKESDELGIKELPAFLISGRGDPAPTQLQLQDPTNPVGLTTAIDKKLGGQKAAAGSSSGSAGPGY